VQTIKKNVRAPGPLYRQPRRCILYSPTGQLVSRN